jgi:LacI family transcriptional regulator
MKRRRTTIQDIADKLDVTASTVSRALQDHPRISDATKASVLEMAEELDYKPNNVASALRSGKSHVVGIIIPRIDRFFFASILRGIEDVTNEAGYRIVISQTHDSTAAEKTSIATLLEARVDGIMASYAIETRNFNHYKNIVESGIPLILFDRLHETLESYEVEGVVLDDYLGAFKATEHLVNQGYKRIAHFAGPQHVSIYKERQRGYEEAHRRHNMPIDEELIMESDVKLQAGRDLGKKLASSGKVPEAIFSSSDYAAAGAMEVLAEHGFDIPRDIAIAGFGNEPFTSFMKLTTVDQHGKKMGRRAAQLFLDQMKDGDTNQASSKIVLNPDLIVRKSSLKEKK